MPVSSSEKQSRQQALVEEASASTLVLFDFDGTITTRDTLIEFVRFYRGSKQYWLGMAMLAPVLALYALKILPNWKAKQYFLTHFFKGEPIRDFNSAGTRFSKEILPGLIRPGALEAIHEYKRRNATLAVVTASAENWVKPWCDQNGLLCLGTRLEEKNGGLTGNIKGRNCYGDEKACRIREHFDLAQFDTIIAYGDTSGDKEMLALAHKQYYKPWRQRSA
jgi:HAD superfamily hydrolase (TIGR01490 family)